MKLDLHLIAIDVFQFCLDHTIAIDIQWVPRAENERADFISRLIDPDDWQISTDFFQYLDVLWGPHTVDCFANYYNYKIPRFFPRFWNPNTSGVDCFVQNLTNENCLAVPPVSIVSRPLHYFRGQKAAVTLVVPSWPSANFWSLIFSLYKAFVIAYKTFSRQRVLMRGRNTNSLLGSRRFKGDVLAIRFKFDSTV